MTADHNKIRRTFEGPMNERQQQFLRDLAAFAEYAIRNGLSFPMAVSTIVHDVNGIVQTGFEFSDQSHFLPKVSGYSSLDEDSVGQSEEASDAA